MLIKNGIIVTEDGRFEGGLRIRDGKITAVGTELEPEGEEEVLDAEGAYILPGGVDVHTHIDMPAGECMTSDDYLTGTRAAVMGGTTTVMDFPEYDEGETLMDGLNCWRKKSEGRAYCDYGFHMTVSGWDEGMKEQLVRMKEQGITSFKAYTAYQDGIGVYDEQLFGILQEMKELDTLLCVHCENGDVLRRLQRQLREENASDIRNHPKSRPNLTEKEAVSRVIDFAAMADVPVYIVHVSTKEAAEVIRQAKQRGQRVYAETCPQYLLLDESLYDLPGFESAKYVLSPPLRTKADQEALWKALADGSLFLPVSWAEGPGERGFHKDSKRNPGNRDTYGTDAGIRKQERDTSGEISKSSVYRTGKALRSSSCKRDDKGGRRCGSGHREGRCTSQDQCRNAVSGCRLYAV